MLQSPLALNFVATAKFVVATAATKFVAATKFGAGTKFFAATEAILHEQKMLGVILDGVRGGIHDGADSSPLLDRSE